MPKNTLDPQEIIDKYESTISEIEGIVDSILNTDDVYLIPGKVGMIKLIIDELKKGNN